MWVTKKNKNIFFTRITTHQNVWNAAKVVLKGKFIAINIGIKIIKILIIRASALRN